MTKFRPAVLTDAGQSLATQAETGQIKLTFTKGVLSSDDLSQLGQTAIQQTSSLNPFITCTISASNTISANKVGLPLNFSNEQMTQDNLAKTVGVYASDGTTEYLYALCINDAPLLISAYNGSTPEALEIEFRTEVGRASTINVTVSPMDTASKEQLSVVASQAGSAVSSNASQISNNSSAIAGLQTQINTNNTGLWNEVNNTINPSVASNSSAIAGLQTSVGNISSAVANNSAINAEFSIANSNIATNSSNITSLNNAKEDASQHKADLDNLKNSLKTSSTLPSGTDLNNVTDAGDYQIMWNYTYLNAPIQSKTTMLLSVKNNGNEIYQTIKHPWTDTMLVRKRTFGNWSEWTELATAVSVNNAYQNAVNTAKAYTDSKATVTMTISESDAISQAKSASSSGLFLYPTSDDLSTIQSYKHVLGIYSYGAGNLPTSVYIVINNLSYSSLTFNNVYGIYTPNNQTVTLHGSISSNSTISANTPIFNFNISAVNMDEITSSFLNGQSIGLDTDILRQNVVGTTNAGTSNVNLEGITIQLAYDSSLSIKTPNLASITYQQLQAGLSGGSIVDIIQTPEGKVNCCVDFNIYNSGGLNDGNTPIEVDLPGVKSVGWNGQAMTLDFYNINYLGTQYQAFTNNGIYWFRLYNGTSFNDWGQITQDQFKKYVKTSN